MPQQPNPEMKAKLEAQRAERDAQRKRQAPYNEKPTQRRFYRKWKPEKLLDAVRAECMKAYAINHAYITAESVAMALNARKSLVTAAFQKLSHEGIVGHKTRGRGWGRDWSPSIYALVPMKKVDA